MLNKLEKVNKQNIQKLQISFFFNVIPAFRFVYGLLYRKTQKQCFTFKVKGTMCRLLKWTSLGRESCYAVKNEKVPPCEIQVEHDYTLYVPCWLSIRPCLCGKWKKYFGTLTLIVNDEQFWICPSTYQAPGSEWINTVDNTNSYFWKLADLKTHNIWVVEESSLLILFPQIYMPDFTYWMNPLRLVRS